MPAVAQPRRCAAALSHQGLTMNAETENTGLRYDLVALPVTDPRGALLGRITVGDAVDVLEDTPASIP